METFGDNAIRRTTVRIINAGIDQTRPRTWPPDIALCFYSQISDRTMLVSSRWPRGEDTILILQQSVRIRLIWIAFVDAPLTHFTSTDTFGQCTDLHLLLGSPYFTSCDI